MKINSIVVFALFVSMSSFIVSNVALITETQEETILEKIANAHGFENWKQVNELKFTFNVDRDTTHFERSWTWGPKTNAITSKTAKETISYNRKKMDSAANKTNAGFTNDKFWLLTPFQLVWNADNITYTHTKSTKAPISKKSMQRLIITYGNEGGYTPGDAYDIYFGDDFLIKEWVFRKANQKEPSMTTTFEDYQELSGLKFATMHRMAEGDFKLYFTDVVVK